MSQMLKDLPADAVYSKMKSPVGKLILIASSKGLHAVLFDKEYKISCQLKKSDVHIIIKKTKEQLVEYFAKKRKNFDIPLMVKGTPFQLKTWQTLAKIPYGQVISYGEQARKMGDKNKARAVGRANSQNPISIIIPCHRVIGKSGKLVGYGGGLKNKEYLIKLEQSKIN